MKPHLIRLRAATESDSEFCYQVKKEALGQYVTQVWGWDETFQREFHRRDFEVRRPDIVVYQGVDIGTLEVAKHSDHIHLGEFYLLPQFQRQGIGTMLLGQVLSEAEEQGLAVRLEVLKINPVQSLYQRHGFVVSGQREHHFLMERAAIQTRTQESNVVDFTRVNRDNLAECERVFVQVFNNPPWNESWEIETVVRRLQQIYQTPGFYGLLVGHNGETIGFAIGIIEQWDKSKHFYLKEMCVASAQQRRGVGAALMNALEENLRNEDVERLYLYTARDTFAQSFYEKQNFYVSAKMIMMTKRLNSE